MEKVKDIKKALGFNPMFSDRETVTEAFTYLDEIASASGDAPATYTGAMVLYNSLIKHLERHYDLYPKAQETAPVTQGNPATVETYLVSSDKFAELFAGSLYGAVKHAMALYQQHNPTTPVTVSPPDPACDQTLWTSSDLIFLTSNERTVLALLARHECNTHNGEFEEATCAEDLTAWVDVEGVAYNSGLTENQVKGVLSSLVKKELITIEEYEPGMNTLGFSARGFAAALAI